MEITKCPTMPCVGYGYHRTESDTELLARDCEDILMVCRVTAAMRGKNSNNRFIELVEKKINKGAHAKAAPEREEICLILNS